MVFFSWPWKGCRLCSLDSAILQVVRTLWREHETGRTVVSFVWFGFGLWGALLLLLVSMCCFALGVAGLLLVRCVCVELKNTTSAFKE